MSANSTYFDFLTGSCGQLKSSQRTKRSIAWRVLWDLQVNKEQTLNDVRDNLEKAKQEFFENQLSWMRREHLNKIADKKEKERQARRQYLPENASKLDALLAHPITRSLMQTEAPVAPSADEEKLLLISAINAHTMKKEIGAHQKVLSIAAVILHKREIHRQAVQRGAQAKMKQGSRKQMARSERKAREKIREEDKLVQFEVQKELALKRELAREAAEAHKAVERKRLFEKVIQKFFNYFYFDPETERLRDSQTVFQILDLEGSRRLSFLGFLLLMQTHFRSSSLSSPGRAGEA